MTVTPEAALVDSLIASIPDFPEHGVTFRDLTPVFADGAALKALSTALTAPFEGRFEYLGGLEARGFLIAGAASIVTGAGVLSVRKAGKLPRAVLSQEYSLEYGVAALEVHVDQLPVGSRVLIVDDVLATGGTALAAANLMERAGWHVTGFAVALELDGLGGRAKLEDRGIETFSLLQY
ncbi:adenine phosphoribosyltransferase [Gryllotalpicola protaetiae]|uniref:Adenine phosphoribosyltransferase n=1 Tax=Gryllotalpicola protaetiae TaxID=2419771 RepID=A0A387BP89_9MICO|nr:adenine phosphoribosyltransferase [Gryllotalpicola protaetiae]AYG04528.1 adenine phosphoribosyltransferase [Gryllotalpicola protaetiae]